MRTRNCADPVGDVSASHTSEPNAAFGRRMLHRRIIDFGMILLSACAVWIGAGCSAHLEPEQPIQKSQAPTDTADVVQRFNYWSDPSLTETDQHANLDHFRKITPEMTRLFSTEALVMIEQKGHREVIPPNEFARIIAKMAFTWGPRQIILNGPEYRNIPDSTMAVVEQYLLSPHGAGDSAVVRYELTMRPVGGRVYITHLSASFRSPTEKETAQVAHRTQ